MSVKSAVIRQVIATCMKPRMANKLTNNKGWSLNNNCDRGQTVVKRPKWLWKNGQVVKDGTNVFSSQQLRRPKYYSINTWKFKRWGSDPHRVASFGVGGVLPFLTCWQSVVWVGCSTGQGEVLEWRNYGNICQAAAGSKDQRTRPFWGTKTAD